MPPKGKSPATKTSGDKEPTTPKEKKASEEPRRSVDKGRERREEIGTKFFAKWTSTDG